MATIVDDEADLTTLVGANDKFKKLVEKTFQNSELGNVSWGEAKLLTKEQFLDNFASNSPILRNKLVAWINDYGLGGRFKQAAPPQGSRLPRPRPPPPSDGRLPAKRPRTSSLAPPSADENQPTNRKSALKYVAMETLYCSSSKIAMDVVQLLETAIRDTNDDKKYLAAANYILEIRKALSNNSLQDEEVNKNERLFTGAFCDALNAVLGDGISVLHQGCIGHRATHSDFSARDVLSDRGSSTLMVGEGKADESSYIRDETRGQVFNELIRHRKIDANLGFQVGSRPVLLLAINFGHVALDLAFPSKKGNAMESKGWLSFQPSLDGETETFWTTPIASVSFRLGEGKKKLPRVLQFIVDALRYLQHLDADLPRQQFKTPFISEPPEKPINGEKRGDNVTIIETESGKRVYKEFCYYLRQDDGFNTWEEDAVDENNQRKPPSEDLLNSLGEPYCNWNVEDGPFGIKILSYDFIEGESRPTSKGTWSQVLQQVKKMHNSDYVHGDMLPRNLIFSEEAGHVIDFDLTRKQDQLYVDRYNHKDFTLYRHVEAQARKSMKKEHDVWALKKMTEEFFDVDLSESEPNTIDELIHVFTEAQPCILRDADNMDMGGAAARRNQKH